MPTITISIPDLLHMTGRIALNELEEALALNKLTVEAKDGGEWKLEATPDRPDLFSAEGIARQLRGWLGRETGLRDYLVAPAHTELQAGHSALRPLVAAGIVRNVRCDDALIRSLFSLQETLDLTLGRSRAKTAIGIHNLDAIVPPVSYRDMDASRTRFIPLDNDTEMSLAEVLKNHPTGRAYAHLLSGRAYPVFTDQQGVISFAPIINSERTRLTASTRNIFFEMQGTDQRTLDAVLNILVTALADRGGTIEAVNIIRHGTASLKPQLDPALFTVSMAAVRSLIGLPLTAAQTCQHLERMRYGAIARADTIDVMAPAYRADLLHPVDLIEDIAIAAFPSIQPVLPLLPVAGSADPLEEHTNTVRLLMVGLGFTEVLNFSLTSADKLQKTRLPAGGLVLENPVSLDYSLLRQHLLPSLIENLARNTHRRFPQQLFEIADTVLPDPKAETRCRNVRTLGVCISHAAAGLPEITSIVRAIAENLRLDATLCNTEHPSLIPGRAGAILQQGREAGFFGEIHPEVLQRWGLKNPVAALELRLERHR